MTLFEQDFRSAWKQRNDNKARGRMVVSDAAERRYHLAIGNLLADRGYLNLAKAHLCGAKDCPAGCGCLGCAATKLEADEAKARKWAKQRKGVAA